MVSSMAADGLRTGTSPMVRKSDMGSLSSGGSLRKRYPIGVWVALANFSSLLVVGPDLPDSQSGSSGKR